MTGKRTIKAEVFRGPFDPDGQPDLTPRNPLELSFFAWNVRGGLSATKAVMADPARYRDYWHWPTARRLLAEADRIGFDFQVQYGMWTGWGGATGWNDEGLDFATAGAASAAVTDRLGLFTTAHVGYEYHPMHIAKIGACIDFISEGRWGLNIVAGAIPEDFRKFGIKERPPGPERYAKADEFTTLMKYLWTSDDPVDFEGEHYQCYGGFIAPKPVRKPRPVLMNAGQSDAGFDFACRQADWVFVVPPTGLLEDYGKLVEKAHALASQYGREVRVGAMCYAVIEEDDAAARQTVAWLEEEADREAVFNYVNAIAGTSNEMADEGDADDPWAGLEREDFLRVALGMTEYQLFGGPETVAERMRGLAEVGVDNVVVGFFDPAKGLGQMEESVIPILKRMGLRA